MNQAPSTNAGLLAALEDAQALLETSSLVRARPPGDPASLPSLLEACEAAIAAAPHPPMLRSLHHFAATGGTLISKCLALMPNVTLLSELDPLSNLHMPKSPMAKPAFWPTDPLYAGRVALRPIDPETVRAGFDATLVALRDRISARGGALVLRDHAHSQFCMGTRVEDRPTLYETLFALGPTHSVVTLRHPIDAFMSLTESGWLHFSPPSFAEYCARHLMFLDRHEGLPQIRYEDFVADPEPVMAKLCRLLHLPFRPGFAALLTTVRMSGDSGRKGEQIQARSRRPVSKELRSEVQAAPNYAQLCARLGYATDLEAAPIAQQ